MAQALRAVGEEEIFPITFDIFIDHFLLDIVLEMENEKRKMINGKSDEVVTDNYRCQLLLITINDRTSSRNSTTPSKVEVSPSDAEFREVSRAVRFAVWIDPDRLHHSDGDSLLQSTGKSRVRRRRALSAACRPYLAIRRSSRR